MRSLLQALKLCFWALPAQRLCTIAGVTLLAVTGLWLAPTRLSTGVLGWVGLGVFITFLPVLVMGGPLWRAFSAQRAVALAPHGRARLLLGAVLIAALSSVALGTYDWLLYLWLPAKWQLGLGGWWRDVSGTFVFASWWAIASFLAARSLLATFTVLLVLLGGGAAIAYFDLPAPNEWLPGGGLSTTLLLWIIFSLWYLRARRIRPSAWTSRRVEDEALVTQADVGGIGAQVPRAVALQRLMLGGRGMERVILQWLLALVLLQAMLLAIRTVVDVPPSQVAPLQYLVLLLALPGMAALSWLVASRLRPLWLSSGCSRAELFGLGEGTLLKLALGLSLVSGAIFVALWKLVPSQVPMSSGALLALGLCSLAGAVLLPVYAALLHQGTAAVAALVMAVVALGPTYLKVFVNAEPAGSLWWLAVFPLAIVALRELARRRWRDADMPRAAASAPAS
jgi:hypothetical protein